MAKAPDAFRTISEAAEQLDLPQHVLRHWEDVFGTIRPMRRAGGRRYYRSYDLELLNGVKTLLYKEQYTTKGVQKIFKDNGAQFVAEIGRRAFAGEEIEMKPAPADSDDDEVQEEAPAPAIPAIREEDHVIISKETLRDLLKRLEAVQDNLDEATLAIDTIVALDES
ncbi:MerR family transcriptional regulator [Parvularcula flava]|uniref:MerR family transcriptional regulator n=1 Tax=Aquisalinus luteolus TaxID=1566827 RepID=A0A8J3A2X3_9PROT|nr:MerR family transcriptional regulator [Aquisalinus luteolus]NHK27592.1 MerR family transcriptional regulator [Aquisalinus luteolus]GGH95899.1 hypothetical protein GCM10011355_13530 [Aquisalinus luteolus]